MQKWTIVVSSAVLAGSMVPAIHAQANANANAIAYPSATGTQTETDEYTRYELLAPETASFKIYYEVTATTAGATSFYNPIRKGSEASDESVTDAMTGKPLHFEVVSGAQARQDPLMARADVEMNYIKVTLARPVPAHGQGRMIIVKTYKDPKSYFTDAAGIVFNRPLGIKRNKVVLPRGLRNHRPDCAFANTARTGRPPFDLFSARRQR